jgi:hypothetical protein
MFLLLRAGGVLRVVPGRLRAGGGVEKMVGRHHRALRPGPHPQVQPAQDDLLQVILPHHFL